MVQNDDIHEDEMGGHHGGDADDYGDEVWASLGMMSRYVCAFFAWSVADNSSV